MSKKKTHEEYISEVQKKNPNVEVVEEYRGKREKILHRCKVCGHQWPVYPGSILQGYGCPKCGRIKQANSKKMSHEKYLSKLSKLNSNIEVLEKYNGMSVPIRHRCKVCGYGKNGEWDPKPCNILHGDGCPVCCFPPKKIGQPPEYKNSIWASEYKKLAEYYGMAEEQMKEIMPMSHKNIDIKCPNCGNIKLITPMQLFKTGLSCSKCSDGISYPEKFMISLLDQLHFKYQLQYSPNWADDKKYDFYIPNYNCIVETHGGQHYKDQKRGRSLKEEQENDLLKENVARLNGIIKYIVLDCRESVEEWIKNSIMNSDIPNLLHFTDNDINWSKCNIDALSSKVKYAAVLWSNGLSIGKIAKNINVNACTVTRWLKKAANCGMCDYTPEKSKKRQGELMRGRTVSEESKRKNSESHKGVQTGENETKARKVIRLVDFKIYGCLNYAAQNNNISNVTMRNRCKAHKDFMYYDEWLAEQENLKGEVL